MMKKWLYHLTDVVFDMLWQRASRKMPPHR
jgi:hypothetical protein